MSNPGWKRIGAYTGVVLMGLHALLSTYWALGGTWLLGLLSNEINDLAVERPTWFVVMIWSVVSGKLIVCLIGIGLLQSWFDGRARVGALVVSWGAALVLLLYGTVQMATGVAVLAGVVSGPDPDTAMIAYLLLWAPLWIAIGVGYLLLSLNSGTLRSGREAPADSASR
jgi:hypothetical protein